MKKVFAPFFLALFLIFHIVAPAPASAACAKVSLEILQSLTLERVAFDAKLVLTNNVPDTSLENVRLDIIIKNNSGENKDTLFFVRKPVLSGVSALDGTGVVPAGGKAEAHWLIIPSPGAGIVVDNGVVTQTGVDYWVGATLTYTIQGKQEVVPINPDKITVKPMPQLVLDYFLPYNVIGDNPFTSQVEPPVPYQLAVRVLNDGYGPAMKLKIDSAQPRITKNDQGLLIDFKMLGAAVNDSAVTPTLTVNFGDLPSKRAATAWWQMMSTLTGRFIEFKAEFSHDSELGGELTSLIRETNAHYLTHMIKVNLPGRDGLLDYLAQTSTTAGDEEHLPDAIFESEIPNGSKNMADARSPVAVVRPLATPSRPTPQSPSVSVVLPVGQSGWIYTKMEDPAAGLLRVQDVVRSDGIHLDPHNFWVEEGVDANFNRTFSLNFVDYRLDENAPGTYTVTYATPDVDTTPPTTSIIFDGAVSGTGPYHIPLETRVVLSARDNDGGSGVAGMFKKLSGEDDLFVPAYPFNFDAAGSYTLEYYSADRAGNVEASKSVSIQVVGEPPVITSFSVQPSVFAPQAPKGVVASRQVEFTVRGTSAVPSLAVEVAIATGNEFSTDRIVRVLKADLLAGGDVRLTWDGRDSWGKFVPSGPYNARLTVSDRLGLTGSGHTATASASITVAEWFAAVPLDPNPSGAQLHPKAFGKKVVWQDQRNGNWDIYLKDVTAGGVVRITTDSADQAWPAIDGTRIVWQDNRNGNWDIYGYDMATGTFFNVVEVPGDQERPAVAGDWVVWQDRRDGNWDIRAFNLSTREDLRITSHERDQLHVAISGSKVVWEDYRHGLPEIYAFDLATRTESRVTVDQDIQAEPAAAGSTVAWTDQRNGRRDIYVYTPSRGTLRITYGEGEHRAAAISGETLVYTDYRSGTDDPNLAFRVLSTGAGGTLTTDPARQEEPVVGDRLVAWQDNRSGRYQIYAGTLELEALPVEPALLPGMNLVAIGESLAAAYPTASALLNAKGSELGIERILSHEPLHNTYREAASGAGDFPLRAGMAVNLYVGRAGSLRVADAGETVTHTLLPGVNQIGLLTVPYGYTAFDLLRSVGHADIQSVRRYDAVTGVWQTATLRDTTSGIETVGSNFMVNPGDGLVLTMKNRVDGWRP